MVSDYLRAKSHFRMKSQKYRGITLFVALIPPFLIILWGEFSEFNINFWLLPVENVPQSFEVVQELLTAAYFLLTPLFLLIFLRSFATFKNSNGRFVILTVSCIGSFSLLRYLEFLYDTNTLSATAAFGNYYPLAFWSLPLLMTALATLFLESKSSE